MKFWLKKSKVFLNLKNYSTASRRIEPTAFVSVVSWWCQYVTSVLCCWTWNFVFYREDWLSIKFGENDSFRKLFLFFENTFQYLGGISQDISVSHFDARRSLSSANRRQIVGDLPGRFFLSALLSIVICMTGRSGRSARALRDGADVVREAIGN